MGSPIIPVPGMPTPIAFFRILALNKTSIFSGFAPKVSVAFATHKATAMGSVQPMAGTTSRCTKAIICFLSASVIPYIFLFNLYTKIYGITNKYQSLPHFFLLVSVITK